MRRQETSTGLTLGRLAALTAAAYLFLTACGVTPVTSVDPVVLKSDPEILAEMQSFLDAMDARSNKPIASNTEAQDREDLRGIVAEASKTLDALARAQPTECLRAPLATYVLRLKGLRDALSALIDARTSGASASDIDFDAIYDATLGGTLALGQALEDARAACAGP